MFTNKKVDIKLIIAFFLILGSNLGWLLPITFIPFLKIPIEHKAAATTISIIMGHATYNLGLLLVGARLVTEIKKRHSSIKVLGGKIKQAFKKKTRKH